MLSMAFVVAIGVTEAGERTILGFGIGLSEERPRGRDSHPLETTSLARRTVRNEKPSDSTVTDDAVLAQTLVVKEAAPGIPGGGLSSRSSDG